MPSLYLDTSALVKLYIEEDGTAEVIGMADDLAGAAMFVLDLTFLESRSAVRRRERDGDVPKRDADRILARIDQDRSSLFMVQPSTSEVFEEAARLLDSHPLRTLDALQLAGCLTVHRSALPPLTFVCADARLCKAARLEGLTAVNPLNAD